MVLSLIISSGELSYMTTFTFAGAFATAARLRPPAGGGACHRYSPLRRPGVKAGHLFVPLDLLPYPVCDQLDPHEDEAPGRQCSEVFSGNRTASLLYVWQGAKVGLFAGESA
jgi:hypothetical protein